MVRVFLQENGYIVLNLKDGLRLYGWPTEWPSSHVAGHFRIQEPEWLDSSYEDGRLALREVSSMLINVDDVRWIEFMKIQEN